MKKLLLVLRSSRWLEALVFNGVLASAEHRRALRSDLQTVVDIGANRGQFALAAREWCPEAKVIAFEPLANAASLFQRLFEGDQQVTFYNVAIGPETTEIEMHVAESDDSSSLLQITAQQAEFFAGSDEVGVEIVRQGRLADFIAAEEIVAPALLKLDVQGYELEALQGCIGLLNRFDIIVVECSFIELYKGQALAHEVIRFLDSQAFILGDIYNLDVNPKGGAIQGEFVFTRMVN